VTGLAALTSGGSMSSTRFGILAGQVRAWGLSRDVPCAFRVIVRRRHGDAALYDRQLRTVEQRFYVARR